MKETLFTKIAQKQIPAYIIDENEEFIAFLDKYPTSYGQTLVVPKNWHDSYIFRNESDFISRLMQYTKSIALKLDAGLESQRCILMFEGLEIDHLHAKLYPVKIEDNTDIFKYSKIEELHDQKAQEILSKLNN